MTELSMGANSVYAAVSKSGSIPIITLYWPPITFTVGVVPFVITLAMPIAEEWKVEFTTTASLSARTNAKGNVEYGVTYKDGDLVPVNKHSYSRDGQFEKIEISTQPVQSLSPSALPVSRLTLSSLLSDRRLAGCSHSGPAARDGGHG
jgi:hypothetical protein